MLVTSRYDVMLYNTEFFFPQKQYSVHFKWDQIILVLKMLQNVPALWHVTVIM